jgi:hypothetical protein
MGGAVDFVGDIVGGAADAVGDVVGGIGDVVGDVVGSVADNLNPATIAAIIYFATTGDPSALLAEEGSAIAAEEVLSSLGEEGFMDLLSTYGSDAAAAGEIMGGFEPVINVGNLYNAELGSGNILESLGSQFDINDALNAGDYAQTGIGNEVSNEQAQSIWDQIQSQWNQMEPYPGEDGSTATGGTNWGNILQNVGNAVGSGSDVLGGILANAGKAATSPLGLAGLYAGLSLRDQQRINDAALGSFNAYQTGKAGKKQQFTTGQGLPSLNITQGGVPLASAPIRTAANTVVRPGRADGGSMSNMLGEYMNLNSAMRNYKMRSKGGVV